MGCRTVAAPFGDFLLAQRTSPLVPGVWGCVMVGAGGNSFAVCLEWGIECLCLHVTECMWLKVYTWELCVYYLEKCSCASENRRKKHMFCTKPAGHTGTCPDVLLLHSFSFSCAVNHSLAVQCSWTTFELSPLWQVGWWVWSVCKVLQVSLLVLPALIPALVGKA